MIDTQLPLLDVRSISSFYGLSQALFDVSLSLKEGEMIALVGRNGVGKSTTLRSIMGLTPAADGDIFWKGESIVKKAPFQNCRAGIAFVPEDRRIFSDLSVAENLEVARVDRVGDFIRWDEKRVYELFPDLYDIRNRKGGVLSGGQQQMLTIGRSLMSSPELLLLDEPSEGLAPMVVESMKHGILTLKERGLSIILAEQNLQFVLQTCDRAVVLEKGQVVVSATTQELLNDTTIQERYLAL